MNLPRCLASLLPLLFACPICRGPQDSSRTVCSRCQQFLSQQAIPRYRCRRCATPLPSAGTCPACLAGPTVLGGVRAAFDYTLPLDHLLHQAKFRRNRGAMQTLALLFAEQAMHWLEVTRTRDHGLRPVLVPVPLHPQRQRRRGYNQAAWLARCAAGATGLAMRETLLERKKRTLPQSDLAWQQRRKNVRDAFTGRDRPPRQVILVDDVMTSGSTLESAARSLKALGAQDVSAWVLLRAGR
ncbi:MAG: ComF family protein [Gammaproteobacteria bacterium]|nr:ComF family protein [Gammaproteobacteria bacterium]